MKMNQSGVSSKDKIALVSGANRGIGLETCRQLAQIGFQVILTSRDPEQGQNAIKKISLPKTKIFYHQLDVTDQRSILDLRSFVVNEFGGLDVLINNAGIYLDQGVSAFELSIEDFRKTLDVNLFGAFQLCQAFVPLMVDHDYGRVVNISSGMGSLDKMGGMNTAYKVSKTALNALTRIFAGELSNTNVKVNAMCPGWVRTRMGGLAGPRSLEQGVDTIIWLATLPFDGPSGGCFRDRKSFPW